MELLPTHMHLSVLENLPTETLQHIYHHICPPTELWGVPADDEHNAFRDGGSAWRTFLALRRVSKRLSDVAMDMLYRYVLVNTGGKLAYAFQTFVRLPNLASKVEILDLKLDTEGTPQLHWDSVVAESLLAASITSSADPAYKREALYKLFAQCTKLSTWAALSEFLLLVPNLHTIRVKLPSSNQKGRCDLKAALGPLFFDDPNSLLQSHALTSTLKPLSQARCFGDDKLKSMVRRLESPLSKAEIIRIDLPSDGPEHKPGCLVLHLDPTSTMPLFQRIRKITITSTTFLAKLLPLMADLKSLEVFEARCINLGEFDDRVNAPRSYDAPPHARSTVPAIPAKDRVHVMNKALQHVRKNLTRLELDLLFSSETGYNTFYHDECIWLDRFSCLTHLSLTLTAAFSDIGELEYLVDSQNPPLVYEANKQDFTARFPRSLVSLTLIDFWEFEPVSNWNEVWNEPASVNTKKMWIGSQREILDMVQGLTKLLSSVAAEYLPKLRQFKLVAVVPEFPEEWNDESLLDEDGKWWWHWTNHMSEEEIQLMFSKSSKVVFRLGMRSVEPGEILGSVAKKWHDDHRVLYRMGWDDLFTEGSE